MKKISPRRIASGLTAFLVVSTLLVTALVSYSPASALSNSIWEPLTTGTPLSGLQWNAVSTSTDGSKVVAAQADGGIWTSTDSGATWTLRTEGNDLMDNRYWSYLASSADGSKLLAVAYDGYDYGGNDVWTSTDGGESWVNRNVDGATFTMDSFVSSASSSDGTNLVIGLEDGTVYRSTNSGANWTEIMGEEGNNVPLVITSNATGTKLAIGKPGGIYVSTDSGATWEEVTDPDMQSNDGNIRGLAYAGTSTLYASQETGDLWKSTDDGQTWTNLTADNDEMSGITWLQLDSSADGLKVVAATDIGSIWTTDDGGTSWTDAKVASPELNGKYFWTIAIAGDGSKAYAPAWEGDIWGTTPGAGGGSDTDGVSDATEDAAPNSGDANNDGTPDSEQNNVSSFKNADGSKYIALEVDDNCDLSNVASASESSKAAQDSGYTYPAGLVNFTATCESATVKLFFYGESDSLTVRKFFPNTNTYSTISSASKSTQTIGGQAATVVTYTVTDGGELDVDGADNGVIVDPVGLGQVQGLSETGFTAYIPIILSSVLLTASLLVARATNTKKSA